MSDDADARFEAYSDGLASVLGRSGRGAGLRDYCTGLMLPLERKSIEPLAAVDVAVAGIGPAPVADALRQRLAVVGPEVAGQGGRDGAAGDRAPWADRGLDHRRHRLSQEGSPFGGGGAAVLRGDRQAGQLPGGGEPVVGQRLREPAGGVPTLSAEALGRGRGAGAARRGFPIPSPSPPSRRSPWSRSAGPARRGCRGAWR